jgi:hypothetical protein
MTASGTGFHPVPEPVSRLTAIRSLIALPPLLKRNGLDLRQLEREAPPEAPAVA